MSDAEEALVITFVPALVDLLQVFEREKGMPLTEEEVLKVRGSAPAIMLPMSDWVALTTERGYADIDPENCWQEWQAVRAELAA
jgi:hypothetical protein